MGRFAGALREFFLLRVPRFFGFKPRPVEARLLARRAEEESPWPALPPPQPDPDDPEEVEMMSEPPRPRPPPEERERVYVRIKHDG